MGIFSKCETQEIIENFEVLKATKVTSSLAESIAISLQFSTGVVRVEFIILDRSASFMIKQKINCQRIPDVTSTTSEREVKAMGNEIFI